MDDFNGDGGGYQHGCAGGAVDLSLPPSMQLKLGGVAAMSMLPDVAPDGSRRMSALTSERDGSASPPDAMAGTDACQISTVSSKRLNTGAMMEVRRRVVALLAHLRTPAHVQAATRLA